ncbi:MAG TPA: c-type cytochrome [Methyloceanibacter sp.]|nr:c-type cytochrome [Methyloceanibacter sp.]
MRKFGFLGLGAMAIIALAGPASAAGDADAGRAAFAKCGICHQVGPDAQIVVGPPLTGVVGRKAASYPGFTYSPGMKKLGDEGYVWTPENIDAFIADPKKLLPASPMSLAFQGVPDAAERANIIAYLQTLSN